jgi:hypothetical protein
LVFLYFLFGNFKNFLENMKSNFFILFVFSKLVVKNLLF